MFCLSQIGGRCYYWHVVGRGQGCCQTSCDTQVSVIPPTHTPQNTEYAAPDANRAEGETPCCRQVHGLHPVHQAPASPIVSRRVQPRVVALCHLPRGPFIHFHHCLAPQDPIPTGVSAKTPWPAPTHAHPFLTLHAGDLSMTSI